MIDIMPTVYTALSNDSALCGLLAKGKNSMFTDKAPDAGKYPAIVYAMISDVPILAADDSETMTKTTIQVSILSLAGSQPIANRINALMVGLGFVRIFTGNIADPANNSLKIKVMRYNIALEQEN